MKKINHLYPKILLLTVTLVVACQDVIEVDLEEGEKRLVVEANLIKQIGQDTHTTQTIKLSLTDGFYEQGPPPPAQGAEVWVIDEQGDTTRFRESSPGIYTTESLSLADSTVLNLEINYDGERYSATDRIRPVPYMDTIFVRREKTAFDEDTVWAIIGAFSDPAEYDNYYLWEVVHLDKDTVVFFNPGEDRYWNGGVVDEVRLNFFFEPVEGSLIRVYQHAISKEAFAYYTYLFELINQHPGPFDVPPAPAKGNIANITRPMHYPLGYFRVTEAHYLDVRVQ